MESRRSPRRRPDAWPNLSTDAYDENNGITEAVASAMEAVSKRTEAAGSAGESTCGNDLKRDHAGLRFSSVSIFSRRRGSSIGLVS